MADGNPPEEFTFHLPALWPAWRDLFLHYMVVNNLTAEDREVQVSTLLYVMGPAADTVFKAVFNYTDAWPPALDELIEKFNSYFYHPGAEGSGTTGRSTGHAGAVKCSGSLHRARPESAAPEATRRDAAIMTKEQSGKRGLVTASTAVCAVAPAERAVCVTQPTSGKPQCKVAASDTGKRGLATASTAVCAVAPAERAVRDTQTTSAVKPVVVQTGEATGVHAVSTVVQTTAEEAAAAEVATEAVVISVVRNTPNARAADGELQARAVEDALENADDALNAQAADVTLRAQAAVNSLGEHGAEHVLNAKVADDATGAQAEVVSGETVETGLAVIEGATSAVETLSAEAAAAGDPTEMNAADTRVVTGASANVAEPLQPAEAAAAGDPTETDSADTRVVVGASANVVEPLQPTVLETVICQPAEPEVAVPAAAAVKAAIDLALAALEACATTLAAPEACAETLAVTDACAETLVVLEACAETLAAPEVCAGTTAALEDCQETSAVTKVGAETSAALRAGALEASLVTVAVLVVSNETTAAFEIGVKTAYAAERARVMAAATKLPTVSDAPRGQWLRKHEMRKARASRYRMRSAVT